MNILYMMLKQMNKRARFSVLVILSLFSFSCSHTITKETYPIKTEEVCKLDHRNFDAEIKLFDGTSFVLFIEKGSHKTNDIETLFKYFAHTYSNRAKFCIFYWTKTHISQNKFKITLLPTVILYQNRYEIDRLRGIPKNDRFEVWVLKNTEEVKEYDLDYNYVFKNTNRLTLQHHHGLE